jgi:hypothetical protein
MLLSSEAPINVHRTLVYANMLVVASCKFPSRKTPCNPDMDSQYTNNAYNRQFVYSPSLIYEGVGLNLLIFRILLPYIKKRIGIGNMAAVKKPNNEVAQGTPRLWNLYVY